jgi:hypothetical protein
MDMGDDHKSFVKNWVLGVHGAHYQAGSVNSYIDGYVLKCVVKYIVIPCYLYYLHTFLSELTHLID